jgi:hypothetical protein
VVDAHCYCVCISHITLYLIECADPTGWLAKVKQEALTQGGIKMELTDDPPAKRKQLTSSGASASSAVAKQLKRVKVEPVSLEAVAAAATTPAATAATSGSASAACLVKQECKHIQPDEAALSGVGATAPVPKPKPIVAAAVKSSSSSSNRFYCAIGDADTTALATTAGSASGFPKLAAWEVDALLDCELSCSRRKTHSSSSSSGRAPSLHDSSAVPLQSKATQEKVCTSNAATCHTLQCVVRELT